MLVINPWILNIYAYFYKFSLPSFKLHLCSTEDDEHYIRILVDTNTAMNTSNLAYHKWVIPQFPHIISEYVKFGSNVTFVVAQLFVTLDLGYKNQSTNHGKMTAVYRFHTPYNLNKN